MWLDTYSRLALRWLMRALYSDPSKQYTNWPAHNRIPSQYECKRFETVFGAKTRGSMTELVEATPDER
jgi:hypothetical protein